MQFTQSYELHLLIGYEGPLRKPAGIVLARYAGKDSLINEPTTGGRATQGMETIAASFFALSARRDTDGSPSHERDRRPRAAFQFTAHVSVSS